MSRLKKLTKSAWIRKEDVMDNGGEGAEDKVSEKERRKESRKRMEGI